MVFKSSLNRNGEGVNVSSINGETGDITLTSSGGTIAITEPTAQTINLESNVPTGLSYQGTWNALTNTPALASGVGTNGYYYIVSVAGTTNLDGITDWDVGDWAIFNGTVWQKIDNSDTQYVLKSGDTMTGTLGNNPVTSDIVSFSSHSDIDESIEDINIFNFGQSGYSIWFSNFDSGDGAVVFDTAFQAYTGINVEVGGLISYGDISANGTVSASAISGTTGFFATTTTPTLTGSPNLIVTAVAFNNRTARFGAYSNTTGVATFSAALTSASSTGAATHDLASGVTVGGAYNYRAGGTDIALADGGTNASLTAVAGGLVYSTASAMAISAAGTAGQLVRSAGAGAPVYTSAIYPDSIGKGALVYGSATNVIDTLAPNITPTKMFLTQSGNGVTANDPAWGLIAGTDISVSFADGTVLWAESGTITGDPNDYNFNYEVATGVLHMAKTNLTGYINFQEVTELDSDNIPLIQFGNDAHFSYNGVPFQIKWYAPAKGNPNGSLRFEDTAGALYNIRANYQGAWTGDAINLASSVTGTLPGGNGGTGATSFGAANRIPYASSSTVLTNSANLTYDGTTLTETVSNTSTAAQFRLVQSSTGDCAIGFDLGSGTDWIAGIDNSDSDAFIFATGSALGTNNRLKIDTSGVLQALGGYKSADGSTGLTASGTFQDYNNDSWAYSFKNGLCIQFEML